MFYRRKSILIDLAASVGAMFLSIMLLGAQGPSNNSSFSREWAVKDQRVHQPMRHVGPVNLPSSVQHDGSPASLAKSNPAEKPSGVSDRKVSVADQPGTDRRIDVLPLQAHADVKTRFTTAEEAPQKTHRGGLYAVLLLLLAGSQH